MKETFKKLIAEWWESVIPPLVKREISLKLDTDILALLGPRRVGKTSCMLLLIQDILKKVSKEETVFIDFEDNRLIGLTAENLDDLFVAHQELSSTKLKYLFFDEIQAMPSWSRFLRRLHNQKQYQIVVSGSSSRLLSKEVATELRGRYKSIFISPFSFREFLPLKKLTYTSELEYTPGKGTLLRLWNEYLEKGGYPEIILEPEVSEQRRKLQSYFETIFYKDVIERNKVQHHELLETLMIYLLSTPATLFSITQFEKILKERGFAVSKKTISLYLKYLEEAFFTYGVEEFSYSAKKRLMRPKKAYVVDMGLVTFLSSKFNPDRGRLLENCVFLELLRKNRKVFFYNENKECDFVVKDGFKILEAIQVCYELHEENKKRELGGLLEAMCFFKLKEGLILTHEQEKILDVKGKKIKVLPAWKWLLTETNVKY